MAKVHSAIPQAVLLWSLQQPGVWDTEFQLSLEGVHNPSLLSVSDRHRTFSGNSQTKPTISNSSAFTTDLTASVTGWMAPPNPALSHTDPEGKTFEKMVKVNKPLEWVLIQSAWYHGGPGEAEEFHQTEPSKETVRSYCAHTREKR